MRLRNFGATLLTTICLTPGLWAYAPDGINAVYVHTNNFTPGKNSVLGFTRDPDTGQLTEMKNSPFLTGGTGFYNATEGLGPDDTDQEIVATPDRKLIYVVNAGSNTVAGFRVLADGQLEPVPGSPFASGGVAPASLGLNGNELIVMNRGDQDPGGAGGKNAPNYTGFLILANGALAIMPGTQLTMIPGSSPTQALVSPHARMLFDAHLFEAPFDNTGLPPFVPPFQSVLHSYLINDAGQLTPAAAQQIPAPIPSFILGLQLHPTRRILYAGLVLANLLATYTYEENGRLNFVGVTESTPNGGLCWIAVSPDAKNLYSSDAVTDQIDVYSIATDPLHPTLQQTVTLNGPKGPGDFLVSATFFDTTPFQLSTSPDGRWLFVSNHETKNHAGGNSRGNQLHILRRLADGTLSELPSSPYIYPESEVAATAHPIGVLVF